MSYARNDGTDSDVYVILMGVGLVCFCKDHFVTGDPRAMIDHLRWHQAQGDKVPDRTFERLKRDLENNE